MFPATTIERLHVSRKAGIVEDGFPVEGIFEVTERVFVGIVGHVPGREQYGFRYRNSNMLCEGVVEELLVGAPPERVVDNSRSTDGGIFKESAIEWNILGDSVDNNGVVRGNRLHNLVDANGLGYDTGDILAVDAFNESVWKGILLSMQNAYLLHCLYFAQNYDKIG